MGDAQLDRTVRIDTAGDRAVASRDAHRHRLAGHGRGVQAALALHDLSVQRYAVARADQHDIAHRSVLRRDWADTAVRLDEVDRFRTQVDRGHDLPPRALDRTVLKVFAHAVKQHNADRLVERADRPRADRGKRHEEIFVKHAAPADIADRGQQHAPAEQQVRCEHDEYFWHAAERQLTGEEQPRADQDTGKRMAAAGAGLIL